MNLKLNSFPMEALFIPSLITNPLPSIYSWAIVGSATKIKVWASPKIMKEVGWLSKGSEIIIFLKKITNNSNAPTLYHHSPLTQRITSISMNPINKTSSSLILKIKILICLKVDQRNFFVVGIKTECKTLGVPTKMLGSLLFFRLPQWMKKTNHYLRIPNCLSLLRARFKVRARAIWMMKIDILTLNMLAMSTSDW